MQKLQIDFFNHDQNKHDYNNKYEVILISIELCYPLQQVINPTTPEKSVQDEALDEEAIMG